MLQTINFTDMANIELLNCDCMTYMAGLKDKTFDLAIVDPPYGIGMGASLNVNSKVRFEDKEWDKEIPKDEYFTELKRVSVNQIVWGANYFPFLWLEGCKGFVHWDKMNHHENRADGEMAYTSFDRPSLNFRYMWDGNRYGFESKINGVGQPTIRIHPTEKPIALYNFCLKHFANDGDRILDTHLGSGSSAIAAHQMGFYFTGTEIDKDYYDAACKRFKEQTMQQSLNFTQC